MCRGCGAYTQPRNGKGDAYTHCKRCHPGAIERRWTREEVLAAMGEWRERYGGLPSSYDWSRTHARRRGGEALRRLDAGEWPSATVVTKVCGSWAAARAAAGALAAGRESEDDKSPLRTARTRDLALAPTRDGAGFPAHSAERESGAGRARRG